ncbi:DUF3052 family protein [Woeseia oceani]|uniref:DUF3052 domain-containing protein n=1 Tax=Woeseia oceani TaxID=1548547 RepID=A0A193LHW5_9GAMM|nr:DUF3052 family protein [Woeseia oceani]ANO52028.1 DUF3052 domain-containing protein [Woeseia oceani]
MAGYSATPLARKLGIREGARVRLKNEPEHYQQLLAPLPAGVTFSTRLRTDVDLCHFFTREERELRRTLPVLLTVIRQNGCIWVSWPKRASGVATDITEDTIREVALPLGLVDVKVCAVDETWSGLKLVIRKELRTGL